MNNEFFEMNRLDSTNSLDITRENNTPPRSSVRAESDAAAGNTPPAGRKNDLRSDSVIKDVKSKTVLLAVIASFAVMAAAAVIIGIFLSKQTVPEGDFDLNEAGFVTETDKPQIDQITDDVIGTGMLFEDCDILSEPDENAMTVGRLAGKTDVLVYAAEGEYYKISDANKLLVGYVLKEKVNTGNIDLGNPDAPAEIVDDATGQLVGSQKTSQPAATGEVNPEDFPVNSSPYFIYVEKGSHTITIFGKDADGKYTVPKRTFLTATGRTASLTPVGNFTITAKEKWHSWGNCFSPYCCRYYGSLFFHGPLYSRKNFGSLMRGSVNQIGTNASSGCMRTSAQAAYFIYQFCWVGTNVKIVNGSPLGMGAAKPSVDSQYVDPATNQAPVAGIAFGFENKTVLPGDSISVSVSFTPECASNKDCTWKSSDASVASVHGNGDSCTVRAYREGKAVITATSIDGNFTASFTVYVPGSVSSDISSEISSDETEDVSSQDVSSDVGGSTTETGHQDDTVSTLPSSVETSSEEPAAASE